MTPDPTPASTWLAALERCPRALLLFCKLEIWTTAGLTRSATCRTDNKLPSAATGAGGATVAATVAAAELLDAGSVAVDGLVEERPVKTYKASKPRTTSINSPLNRASTTAR